MSRTTLLTASALALVLFSTSSPARAEEECPPGAKYKTEGEFKWCEPTVCDNDAQCATGEVCKPVALCVQIGKVESKPGQDAGSRLITAQRCAEDKVCPNTTVCSEHARCVSRAQADKMAGITVKAAPSSSAAAGSGEAPKKSCGCHAVGARGGELAGLALAAGALAFAVGRRRRR